MRLIDADTLQAKMYYEAFEADSDMQKWDSGCWIRYKLFENCIDSMPTIEPEQKKGKWIRGDQDKLLGRAFCSVCNEWEYQASNFNFCPNCGADMRPDNAPLADDDSIYG